MSAQQMFIRTGSLASHTLLKQRYLITERLGRGGMGAVYKAADTELGNALRAVKEMSLAYLHVDDTQESSEAFKQEALLLATLQHQHLPRIYDHFSEHGRWYLVMDYIEGANLEEYLQMKGGTLPLQEALAIGMQLCTVLDYLHTHQPPIIFRDLKPSNVMRVKDGHIYLIDFGIARVFKSGQAKDTSVFVSYGYAAPEQYGLVQTTPLADIYSLGATLHQMLSGADPGSMPLPWAFPPLHLASSVNATGLDNLIMSMLATNPAQRPASAARIKQELQRIATGQPATGTLSATIRADALQAALPQTPRIPLPLGTVLCNYTGHTSHILGLSWCPDGKRIVTAGSDQTAQIWHAGTGQNLLTYHKHTFVIQAVAWSPDGQYIASSGDNHTVQVWNANTGELVFSYQGHTGYVTMLAWSPDGTTLASGGSDRTIQIWQPTNGRRRLTYRWRAGTLSAMAWSPDGATILSISRYQERNKQGDPVPKTSIAVWATTNGEDLGLPTPEALMVGTLSTVSWSFDGKYIALGGSNARVHIYQWDWGFKERVFCFTDHAKQLRAVAWSPNGRRIASVSNDSCILVWDALTGANVDIYRGTAIIDAVAWSPDSQLLAASLDGKTVQVWQAD